MTFKEYIYAIIDVINTILVPLIITLASLAFIWGVYKYFILGGSEEKSRGEGRSFAIWGLLGLVLVFSIWGLLSMLLSTLGIAPGA